MKLLPGLNLTSLKAVYLQSVSHWYYQTIAHVYDRVMLECHELDLRPALFQNLNVKPGDCVLEVGIGTGMNIPYYPRHAHYVGIDSSREMLYYAQERKKRHEHSTLTLEAARAQCIPYSHNHFDFAISTYFLSATPHQEAVISELERVLKPGGHLGIIDFLRVDRSKRSGYDGTIELDLLALLERHSLLKRVYEERRINRHRRDELREQGLFILEVRK